jgi:hypothetical protein
LKEDTPVTLVRFAVWKKDLVTHNFLGEFSFPVATLLDGVPRDRWYEALATTVQCGGGDGGGW